MSEKFGNKGIDKQKQVEHKETGLEQKLDFLKLPGKENDYSNFIKFLEIKSNIKEYKQILEGLENPDYTDDILDYIENNGYPIGKKFNKFIKDYFDIDIQEEKKKENQKKKKENQEKKKENQEKKKENQEKKKENQEQELIFNKLLPEFLDKNKVLLNKISSGKEFIDLLNSGFENAREKFNQEEANKLFEEIRNSPNLSDKEKEELYNATRDFVIDNFPDIKIPEFKFYKGEWVENENGDPTKILEDVEGNLSDNMVSLDLDHIPPKYDLGRIDSDYKFKNKLDGEQISDLTGEYLDEVKKFQEAGKNLGIVGKGYSKFKGDIQKLWQENIKEIQSGDFSEFKEGLKAYLNSFKISIRQNLEAIYDNNLDIPSELKLTSEDLTELGNIQNPNDLKQKFENFEQKYKALQNYLNSGPNKAYEKYKNKLQQEVIEDTRDTKEQQKQVLEFLHKTGFDLIPQDITDEIIRRLNLSSGEREKFGFSGEIDLKNGEYGVITNNEKEKREIYMKFINRIITGNENYPIQINTINHGMPIWRYMDGEKPDKNNSLKNSIGQNKKDKDGKKENHEISDKKAYINKHLPNGITTALENLGLDKSKK